MPVKVHIWRWTSFNYWITIFLQCNLCLQAGGIRIGSVLAAIVTMGAGLTIAYIFGWKLALAITGAVPILIAGGAIQMKIAKGNQKRDTELMADAGRVRLTFCFLNINFVKCWRFNWYFCRWLQKRWKIFEQFKPWQRKKRFSENMWRTCWFPSCKSKLKIRIIEMK